MSVALPPAPAAAAGKKPPPIPKSGSSNNNLRAYSDPVIFCDDRVLKTLLRKEHRYIPESGDYFAQVQTEVKAPMRKEVADWMLEVCEDQNAQPEVFCLAMNYFDRFLSLCAIGRSQLQLLGAVCLLVAWKVREHEPLPAIRLVEYSDFNLTLLDIMVSWFYRFFSLEFRRHQGWKKTPTICPLQELAASRYTLCPLVNRTDKRQTAPCRGATITDRASP